MIQAQTAITLAIRYLISGSLCVLVGRESNPPPKFVGELMELIFFVRKEMDDAKLGDKEDSRFEGEERYLK